MRIALTVIHVLFVSSFCFAATIYVPDHYAGIQDAINASSHGDTIIVRPGTYGERIDFVGKAVHLRSEAGPATTIIDALGAGSGVSFISGESRNSILEGFTITNATEGGIHISTGSPHIRHNVISGNRNAISGGGGIHCVSSVSRIENNVIENNTASEGGGIYCGSGTLEIAGNVLRNNQALTQGGGGLWGFEIRGKILGNVIADNVAKSHGGGMYLIWTTLDISDNVVSGNSALSSTGGGLSTYESMDEIVNNTFFGNDARISGGVHCSGNSVRNCIFWANTPDQIGNDFPLAVTYCDVEGGWPGSTNFSRDPRFVDPANGDFHLAMNSPCTNRGDTAGVVSSLDHEGDPRIAGGKVDIGADEFYYHLYSVGDVNPGSPVDIKVVGPPGFPALLFLGTGIQDPPFPTPHGDLWLRLPPASTWQLGLIPRAGILSHTAIVPSGWPSGSSHPFQALIGPWGGGLSKLSNPMILDVE